MLVELLLLISETVAFSVYFDKKSADPSFYTECIVWSFITNIMIYAVVGILIYIHVGLVSSQLEFSKQYGGEVLSDRYTMSQMGAEDDEDDSVIEQIIDEELQPIPSDCPVKPNSSGVI